MQDRLVIGIDQSKEKDHTCMMVGRKRGKSFEVINSFYDEEAKQIYNQLTGKNI